MKAKTESNPDFEKRVREIITDRIRPRLSEHGGDLYIKEIHGKDVGIVFSGVCSSCPAAQITLQEIVDKELRQELKKELGRVFLINETDESLLAFARKLLKKK